MAFGIDRQELDAWKQRVASGEIAYLTHFWIEPRWPGITSVTKVGCRDLDKLREWCLGYGLNPAYIHRRNAYPHFDLIGEKQKEILQREGLNSHIEKFRL